MQEDQVHLHRLLHHPMHSGEPGDSVKLRAAELMGKHYGLFTDRIEAVKPPRSSEEIQLELEAKLQQFLLPEAG